MSGGAPIDSAAREQILHRLSQVLPESAIAVDETTLDTYATDYGPTADWEIQRALAVVFPASTEDVVALMRASAEEGFALVPRGAGTSVSGGAHALRTAVTVSLERMNRILSIDVEDQTARVQPGVINADLGEAVAPHRLMYAPDPASYRISTIGGNVATNAGGLRCAKYGVTRDSVLSLEVVLADGSVLRTGTGTFKNVSGYDLTGLFVGSEGTLGIITEITVRLRPLPVAVATASVFVDDLETAAAGVLAISQAGVQPAILEMMDGATMAALDAAHGSALASLGGACLLVQTDGYGADAEMEAVREALLPLGARVSAPGDEQAHRLVDLRRHARGDDTVTEIRVGEDVAVPKSRLVEYVREVQRIGRDHRVKIKVIAHAGDGNLHPSFWIDVDEGTEGMARLEAALDESIRVVLDFGGTITGEHGVGSYKVRWFALEHDEAAVRVQRQIKSVFDPDHRLNPGRGIG
ncbi:MAG: FAD-binding oxidoreductase [Micrococcaceae bacterium]